MLLKKNVKVFIDTQSLVVQRFRRELCGPPCEGHREPTNEVGKAAEQKIRVMWRAPRDNTDGVKSKGALYNNIFYIRRNIATSHKFPNKIAFLKYVTCPSFVDALVR